MPWTTSPLRNAYLILVVIHSVGHVAVGRVTFYATGLRSQPPSLMGGVVAYHRASLRAFSCFLSFSCFVIGKSGVEVEVEAEAEAKAKAQAATAAAAAAEAAGQNETTKKKKNAYFSTSVNLGGSRPAAGRAATFLVLSFLKMAHRRASEGLRPARRSVRPGVAGSGLGSGSELIEA